MNTELMANSTSLMPEQSLHNMYSLQKARHGLPALRSNSQHFSTMLGGHTKQQILNKLHKTLKNMAWNRLQKDTGSQCECWNEKAERHLFDLSWWYAGRLKFFTAKHAQEWLWKCQYWSWVTNEF